MKYYLTRRNNDNAIDMERAFDNLFRPFFFDEEASFMKTDVKELDKAYELEIEMPGFEKNQINMTFENGYVTVSAKKEVSDESKYLKRERSQSYSRSYYVGDVEKDSITAKYNNGVLSVVIPKEEQKKISTNINID